MQVEDSLHKQNLAMILKPWSIDASDSSVKRAFESILKKYGHFALYRRYNIGVYSEFYEEDTGASSGGPMWTYSDDIIQTRHDPMSVRGAVGVTVQTSKLHISKKVKPKRGDVVIEVDYPERSSDPTEHEMYTSDHIEAFEITEVDSKRGFNGRIEFYLVQVIPHMGDY